MCFNSKSIHTFICILMMMMMMMITHVGLLAPHQAPPQVADRGMLTRYNGHRGNKIPGVDQN